MSLCLNFGGLSCLLIICILVYPFSNGDQIFLIKNCCCSTYLWSNRPKVAMLLHLFPHNMQCKIVMLLHAPLIYIFLHMSNQPDLAWHSDLYQEFPFCPNTRGCILLFYIRSFQPELTFFIWTHIFYEFYFVHSTHNIWFSSSRSVMLQFTGSRNIGWAFSCVHPYVLRCT